MKSHLLLFASFSFILSCCRCPEVPEQPSAENRPRVLARRLSSERILSPKDDAPQGGITDLGDQYDITFRGSDS